METSGAEYGFSTEQLTELTLFGILVILHYFWHKAGKNDFSTVIVYGAVLAALLAWRLQRWLRATGPVAVGAARGRP